MNKIAFWVDTHLGQFDKLLGEAESLRLGRKLFSLLLKETRIIGAKHVALLGDVFANPYPSEDVKGFFIDFMSSINDISVIAFPGNHDIYNANNNSFNLLSRLPKAGALTNVRFITQSKTINFADIKIHVVPYGCKILSTDVDLILFHNNVVGAKQDSGRKIEMGEGIHPSKFAEVLAVSGHLHTFQKVGRNIHFPGTAGQNSFGESDEKHFSYLRIGKNLKYCSYTLTNLPWYLKNINWSSENPPLCNEKNTYYKLFVAEERPTSTWMIKHPRVLRIEGGKTVNKETANKIVQLIKGNRLNSKTDSDLLKRYMKNFTPLDGLSILKGIKIHEQLTTNIKEY
jgi:hypothetical protein